MARDSGGGGAAVAAPCAAAFAAFAFCHLFFLEAPVLEMVQHVLSGGATHYDRTVGAVIITVALLLLQAGTARLSRLGGGMYALTFLPSLLVLAVLTGVDPGFARVPFRWQWAWIAPALLAALAVAAVVYRKNVVLFRAPRARLAWVNLLVLAAMFTCVSLAGTTDRVFMYRMRAESLLARGDAAGALAVAERSPDTDASLTMLRAYALSLEGRMGDGLFSYPLAGGSGALLPGGRARCLLVPEADVIRRLSKRKKGRLGTMEYLEYISSGGIAMKPAADYLLCGYLLDRDLESFASLLGRRYGAHPGPLPRHYAEALALCRDGSADPGPDDGETMERLVAFRHDMASGRRPGGAYPRTYWDYYYGE